MIAALILYGHVPDPGRLRDIVGDRVRNIGPAGMLDEGALEPGDQRILLGVGADGCAALARRVAEGLEGVAAVVLIGPEAPWAERRDAECPGADCWLCNGQACNKCGAGTSLHNRFTDPPCEHSVDERHENARPRYAGRLALGPLEPLRAVAERARVGVSCECTAHGGPDHTEDGPCNSGTRYPLRLVVACCPERAVCAGCGGEGRVPCDAKGCVSDDHECDVCSGSGNALGSANVALELSGDTCARTDIWQATRGGLTVSHYADRTSLEEHAIREALKLATENT